MDQKAVIKYCKSLGCCDACSLRYLGLKSVSVFENPSRQLANILEEPLPPETEPTNGSTEDAETNGTPAKKRRIDICVSCLGVLQEITWPQSMDMAKEMVEKKKYMCTRFACALSAPIATILREKAIGLLLKAKFPDYDIKTVTPLKESWKWTFAIKMASHLNMTLDSGAVTPFLITICLEYPDDLQELEVLKTISSSHFEERNKQRNRFAVDFTRRSVEQALESVTLEALQTLDDWKDGVKSVGVSVKCVSAVGTMAPMYLGGRYVKLSRNLPQTPWVVNGKLMMHSSVQDIIFGPIASIYSLEASEVEHRLKMITAGREDVDVRCLGDGRPFAIEISDPRRELTETELQQITDEISRDGKVVVKKLVHIQKEDLVQLKKGEETKTKSYEALCIKLDHSKYDLDKSSPITVTSSDIDRINAYNESEKDGNGDGAKVQVRQKTPIRVLHRRPLLTRSRKIYELKAETIPDHLQLFTVNVSTEAGTYIKEWVHGELGRTAPSLQTIVGAKIDILALDVLSVHLEWPPNK